MPFKPDTPAHGLPALTDYSVLVIHGIDAIAFAQAQLINDLRPLAPGHWQWNGWLTPKGRVIALFALLRIDDTTLWAVSAGFPAAHLRDQLQRFVFRSKLALAVREDMIACADIDASRTEATPAPGQFAGDPDTGIVLDLTAVGGARRLALLPNGHPLIGAPDPATDDAWRLADLRHGLPRLGVTQSGAWTPQMLSLERLDAYSLKKGCYPGQEIVARTHYLGQAKRGLVRLRGSALHEGIEVTQHDKSLGTVICVQADEALAVLSNPEPEQPLLASGMPCTALSLDAGLARSGT